MKGDISPELLAHYESDTLTVATILTLTRLDDEVYGFTDHDDVIPFGGVDHLVTSAFDASANSTRSELNVDNLDVTALLSALGIAANDIETGRWDGATFVFRRVNWADLTMGAEILRVGELGEVQRKTLTATVELRGLLAKLQNQVARNLSDKCDADLGDARCKVNVPALTAYSVAVTAVASQREFTLGALATAAGYSTYGNVTFRSGANNGLRMEVKLHASGDVIHLQLEMPYAIQIGDLVDIEPGCNKLLKTGPNEYLGDCKVKFNNVVNFRGSCEIAGMRFITRIGGQ